MFRPSKYHSSCLKERTSFCATLSGLYSPGSTVSQPLKSKHTVFYVSYRNECLVPVKTFFCILPGQLSLLTMFL